MLHCKCKRNNFSPSIGTLSLDIEYIFDSNFMISLHSGNGTDNVIFGAADNTSLYTLDFFTGYVFQKDKLYITPKVGYSNWRIRLREGEFLSSGEEKVSENDGYDFTIGLDAGYKFTDLFGMSISYHHLNFDYGEYNSYLVNFDFFF